MALLFADPGGEFYFSLGIGAAGIWSASNIASLASNAPAGRASTYAVSQAGGSPFFVRKNLPSSYHELIIGGAYYIPSVIANAQVLFYFQDNSSTQTDIRIDATGHPYATRNGTQIGATSSNQFTVNQGWTYVEARVRVASATGTVDLWVNGANWLSLTGQNTQATSNNTCNQAVWGSLNGQNGVVSYWKDMYCLDTGSGVQTSRLGDVTVGVVYPNAAGTNQQWTANGAGTQVGCVQDGINHTGTWPDGDTTYISDGTIGDISDFQHQSVTVTGTVFGVVHYTYARKDDAGSRTIQQVTVQSGSVTENTADIGLGNTYQYFGDILEQNPTGPATWTASSFNSTNFGVKVTS